MSDNIRISQLPPDRTSMHYDALRQGGIDLIQQLAAETWTDHNVHDPGITILEAFSYAMTELGFRIQLDMPDLLRSGENHAPAELVPAHRVLPSAPITPEDLRKLLLDHYLVSDARINTGADSEVPFFEDQDSEPPFTYVAGTPRVRVQGLYEVMIEFEQGDLNSNTYTLILPPNTEGISYTLDMALPYWDEDEAAPFREGAAVDTVVMLDSGSGVWRQLEEPLTYFGEIQLNYTGPDGSDSIELWILLRITSDLDDPAALIPGILVDARTAVETTGSGSLTERFADRVQTAFGAVQQVQRYVAAWRNLCEEPVQLSVARIQEIALHARIEITGSTDLEHLLAKIFIEINCELSPPVHFYSLAEMRAKGKSPNEIYDGPLLRHGFFDPVETDNLTRPSKLYTSDILRLIMRLRGAASEDLIAQENPTGRDIVAVTDLALSNYINNRPITRNAHDCLRLVETVRYRPRLSLSKSRIVFVRDDVEVSYNPRRVKDLFLEMQQQKLALTLPEDTSPVWPVPGGEALAVEDYYAFQNDLPRIYGVGELGLPNSAGTERKAQALQTKGYLLLFEQFLADHIAQLGHINRFFSADSEENATYFTRALFDLPGIDKLLKRFSPGHDWQVFISDPQNPHHLALQAAAENRDRFLDRRNRMLDHLLARQGEETVALGQEMHRWAQKELTEANMPPAELPDRMNERRQVVNALLIQAKAAFLFDAPERNAAKLQAFSTPLKRQPDLLQIEQSGTDYRWLLTLNKETLLHSVEAFSTEAVAAIAADEAVILAAQAGFFEVVAAGGGRHCYQLKDVAAANGRILGESPQTWSTVAQAQIAMHDAAARFAALRLETSLTPMEQRIAHLTGIRNRTRRHLLMPIDTFFEIYDEVDSDGIIEKRWRLWEQPGYSGKVLLSSVFHFEAPTDEEAVELAMASIRQVLRYGMDEWNYQVTPAGIDTFNFELQNPNGDQLALRAMPRPSIEQAEQAIAATINQLYQFYSVEGFHLIEHLLLRPRQVGDPFLSLSDSDTEIDPYSQHLSLIFPSGYARDFSMETPAENEIIAVTPHRFRDPEFRRHVERVVQQSCPAHLLPAIYWVDREAPETMSSQAGFDSFETIYFNWLDSVLIPGHTPGEMATARNELIFSLNAIATDAAT